MKFLKAEKERKKGISGGEKKCEPNAVLFLPANGEFMKALIESSILSGMFKMKFRQIPQQITQDFMGTFYLVKCNKGLI